MKTAYELLLSAPDSQVKRAQIAFTAVTKGQWLDAAHSLRNAATEEPGQWANYARDLAEHCARVATELG